MYSGCLKSSSLILSWDFVEEAPGQGSALSVQGQWVSIVGFAGHGVSVAAIHLWGFRTKVPTDDT